MKHQKSQILIPFIIISNLFPLYGVLKFNWTIFSVVYIFWLEMLIVSTFLLLKILFSQGDSNATFASKLILATKFFVFRTGIFFFYLLFIVVFLGFLVTGKEDFKNAGIFQTMTLQDPFYKITLLNFVAFNLLEFLVQFLAIGDYKKSKPIDNFVLVDEHMIVVHVVVVLGSFLYEFVLKSMKVNHHTAMIICVALFVLIKILVDIGKQRINNNAANETETIPYI
ncbi:MAG: hypothetical protein KA174_02570 [Chitinophagales bacterium]|nr:hypothetical protein [Chitinophagales bacterium]